MKNKIVYIGLLIIVTIIVMVSCIYVKNKDTSTSKTKVEIKYDDSKISNTYKTYEMFYNFVDSLYTTKLDGCNSGVKYDKFKGLTVSPDMFKESMILQIAYNYLQDSGMVIIEGEYTIFRKTNLEEAIKRLFDVSIKLGDKIQVDNMTFELNDKIYYSKTTSDVCLSTVNYYWNTLAEDEVTYELGFVLYYIKDGLIYPNEDFTGTSYTEDNINNIKSDKEYTKYTYNFTNNNGVYKLISIDLIEE